MTKTMLVPLLAMAVLLIFLASGCADLKSDLPTPENGLAKIHPPGWSDPPSVNFHGKAIRQANWNLGQCQTCHGARYAGGTVNVSCLPCHNQALGPENCATCHGSSANPAPPKAVNGDVARSSPGVGAHQVHVLGTARARFVLCFECHNVPGSLNSPGHIDNTAVAEVPFPGGLTSTVTNLPGAYQHTDSLPVVRPAPVFDAATLSCAGTYCHGTFKNGNTNNSPVWNDTTGSQAACGTCHGDVTKPTLAERAMPKTPANGGTHPDATNCYSCHAAVVDASAKIIDPSKHINGKLDVLGKERDF